MFKQEALLYCGMLFWRYHRKKPHFGQKEPNFITDFEKLENNFVATKKCSTALAIQVKTTSISSINANLPVKNMR